MFGCSAQLFLSLFKSDDESPPPLLRYRSSTPFILTTICIAVFTDIFLYGIVVPVIPFALTRRAGVANEDVQRWVSILLAVYGAALVAFSPFCGWLADRSKSRRLSLLFGLLTLGGATLMLCLGRTISVFVLGRLLQGISAAIVWTVGLALLVDTVGPEEVGQVMGFVSVSMSVGILVAPLLGGVVYSRAGYYGVYYMAFALIILDIILRLTMIEKKFAVKWEKKDARMEEDKTSSEGQQNTCSPEPNAGIHINKSSRQIEEKSNPENGLRTEQITSLGEAPTTFKIQRTPLFSNQDTKFEEPEPPCKPNSLQNSSPRPAPPASPSPVERRMRSPMLILLSSRRLLSGLYCTLVQSILMTAWDAVLPLRVAFLFDWQSLGAGLIFLPLVLPSFLAPAVGAFTDKYGSRLATAMGFIIATPVVILLRLVDHSGTRQIVLLCGLLALLGVALTILMTPLLAEITYILSSKEQKHPGLFGETGAYAQAYGLFNCAFAGGMLLGPIWAGLLVGRVGWADMCLTLGALAAVSTIPAVLFTNGWIRDREQREGDENRGRVENLE